MILFFITINQLLGYNIAFLELTSDFWKNDNVEMTLCLKINVNINKLKALTRSFYLDTVLMKFIKGVLTFFLS